MKTEDREETVSVKDALQLLCDAIGRINDMRIKMRIAMRIARLIEAAKAEGAREECARILALAEEATKLGNA
jgi:hypothetical protein